MSSSFKTFFINRHSSSHDICHLLEYLSLPNFSVSLSLTHHHFSLLILEIKCKKKQCKIKVHLLVFPWLLSVLHGLYWHMEFSLLSWRRTCCHAPLVAAVGLFCCEWVKPHHLQRQHIHLQGKLTKERKWTSSWICFVLQLLSFLIKSSVIQRPIHCYVLLVSWVDMIAIWYVKVKC